MLKYKYRYSFLIKPLSFTIDLFFIFLVVFIVDDPNFLNPLFLGYISVFWMLSAWFSKYYQIYRSTVLFRVLFLCLRQFIFFSVSFFAFFGIFKEGNEIGNQFLVLSSIITIAFVFKIVMYYILKLYRNYGNNFRKVVFVGFDDSAKKIINFFEVNNNLGYKYLGFFSNKAHKNRLGAISESFDYIINEEVDEIYCCLSKLEKTVIEQIIKFANTNNLVLKLIPDAQELYSKTTVNEYYNDSVAVLRVKKMPFEINENHVLKRNFDIIFSIIICVTILIWLVPLLWLLIKFESKGPAIFKQEREGINGGKFMCYKFRSMRINTISDSVHASENDSRVTIIGQFLRKTSIDELPQFFNVLKGEMSVVGPRPHLEKLSLEYQKDVDDYLRRHAVKPGITGLAQVSGYRGEIKKKSDIKNRVRLDIFYIENWSFFLDLKIILKTIFNILRGEDKAY